MGCLSSKPQQKYQPKENRPISQQQKYIVKDNQQQLNQNNQQQTQPAQNQQKQQLQLNSYQQNNGASQQNQGINNQQNNQQQTIKQNNRYTQQVVEETEDVQHVSANKQQNQELKAGQTVGIQENINIQQNNNIQNQQNIQNTNQIQNQNQNLNTRSTLNQNNQQNTLQVNRNSNMVSKQMIEGEIDEEVGVNESKHIDIYMDGQKATGANTNQQNNNQDLLAQNMQNQPTRASKSSDNLVDYHMKAILKTIDMKLPLNENLQIQIPEKQGAHYYVEAQMYSGYNQDLPKQSQIQMN